MTFLLFGLLFCFALKGDAVEYKHLGCYSETTGSPDLNGAVVTLASMSVEGCVDACNDQGFPYAGIRSKTNCLCGNEYGKYGTNRMCNYSCPVNLDMPENLGFCGGVDTNDIYYASDSDPITRVDRVFVTYPGPLSWTDARHFCIKKNGDLAILSGQQEIYLVKSSVNSSFTVPGNKVWVGLFKMSYLANDGTYIWTDPTSYGMDPTGAFDGAADTFNNKTMCAFLNLATNKLWPELCSTTLPFVCKQLPNPDSKGQSATTAETEIVDEGVATEAEQRRSRIMLYVLLPVFIFCYGGSCMVYIIGKLWKNLKSKRKNLQTQSAFEEFEPDTKPMVGAMHKQSPPPPYYQGAHYMGHSSREKGWYPQTQQQGVTRGRTRTYPHEMEPMETKEDEIDFSKLSIQDIIYIKSLMGERHILPDGSAKKKILIA